jgi:cell division protein FtsI/penicillin-binding protein 2
MVDSKMKALAQYRKMFALGFALVAAFGALAWRLVDLQLTRHERFQELAEANTVRTISREPMRGQILDIRGNPLATSLPAKTVCADPTLIGDRRADVARILAPLLETNEQYLVERLAPRQWVEDGKTNTSKYVVLKHKVPIETWERIRQEMANANFGVNESKLKPELKSFYRALHGKAIFPTDDRIRRYPNGRLASHVIGCVANDDEETGQAGIEQTFDARLRGVAGWRHTELDRRQREIVEYRDQDVEPRDGLNVVLTIDAGLQNIVESELANAMREHSPISASAIMVRPRTGAILAMATLPDFDPNHAGESPLLLRNRVISDVVEPGSTFKIVVVTGALNDHVVKLTDVFDCEHGHFAYAGRTLHDHVSLGQMTVEGIITKSSNIGAAKIGIQLGENRLYDYIRDFGFGKRTSIPLAGESPGILAPVKQWTKVSIAQIPMGQGIAVTPLQMVMAMSAIANRGLLMRPMLVDRLEEPDGKIACQYQPQAVRMVAGTNAIADIITALKTVVTTNGTAVKAHMDHYTVAGKTGTAQKVENGHYVQRFVSSFIGFFPVDNPEICISVVLDDPKDGHYGGAVAAPFFKAIAERAANYLNLRPDIDPPSPIKQTLAAARPERQGH